MTKFNSQKKKKLQSISILKLFPVTFFFNQEMNYIRNQNESNGGCFATY